MLSANINGMEIEFPNHWPALSTLLVAGGNAPAIKWLQSITRTNNTITNIVAVDKGISPLRQAQLLPDWLIGDADSASSEDWLWGEQHCLKAVHKFDKNKDHTDLELALQLISKLYLTNTTIIASGVWGGRFDHLFSAIHALARPLPNVIVADEKECMLFMHSQERIRLQFSHKPTNISLLPLTPYCIGVDIDNVRWPLVNAVLSSTFQNAISNELIDANIPVNIQQSEGCLGIYINWL